MAYPRRSKFGAIKTTVDGIRFDSKHEATEYQKLRACQRAGRIRDLRLQVEYELRVNSVLICKYVADFVYYDVETKKHVVADAKGYRTREYILKRRLMMALHGIEILEL